MEVSGQLNAPAAFSPGKYPDALQIEGYADRRTGLDDV
jgi:hypothetical protein